MGGHAQRALGVNSLSPPSSGPVGEAICSTSCDAARLRFEARLPCRARSMFERCRSQVRIAFNVCDVNALTIRFPSSKLGKRRGGAWLVALRSDMQRLTDLVSECVAGKHDSSLAVLLTRTEQLLASLQARIRLLPLSSSALRHLPPELLLKIAEEVNAWDHFPLALTCTAMRDVVHSLPPPPLRGLRPGSPVLMCTKVNGDDSMARLAWAIAMGFKPQSTVTTATAAEAGRLDALQFLRSAGCPWDADTFSWAALEGQQEVLIWAREQGCEVTADASGSAAGNGQLAILKWMHGVGCPFDEATMASAAAAGCIGIMQWLRSRHVGCPWNEDACSSAAESGQLEALRWLHDQGCPWDHTTTRGCGIPCGNSTEASRLACLQFAAERGCPWVGPEDHHTVFNEAVMNQQTAIFRFAVQSGCPISEDELDHAVWWSRRNMVLWAITEGGFAWPPRAALQACRRGDLAMLKRIVKDSSIELSSDCCAQAALIGHIPMIKYLREQGCPWDEDVCSLAALGGHIDVLEYAREEGCPWDEDVYVCAARAGHLDVLEWCRRHGAPKGTGDAYIALVRISDNVHDISHRSNPPDKKWRIIEWLLTHGYPLPTPQLETTNIRRAQPWPAPKPGTPHWLGNDDSEDVLDLEAYG